jgi:hypothetical protein
MGPGFVTAAQFDRSIGSSSHGLQVVQVRELEMDGIQWSASARFEWFAEVLQSTICAMCLLEVVYSTSNMVHVWK